MSKGSEKNISLQVYMRTIFPNGSIAAALDAARRSGCPVVCDGATGTLLAAGGVSREDVCALYLSSGAEALTTDTLLTGVTEADEVERRTAVAVRLAGGRAWVMGSAGPSDSVDAYARHFEALERGGADVLLMETMTGRRPVMAGVEAWRSVYSGSLPLIVSFTPDASGECMLDGGSLGEMAAELVSEGVMALGVNCGCGMGGMMHAVDVVARAGLPVVVRPSLLGEEGGRLTAAEWTECMMRMVMSGCVAMAGGCCGTTPECVRLLKNACDEWCVKKKY